jgi:hypothetical protein
MTTVSVQRLATIFVEVADTLVDEFDLIDFLHMLTDRAASLVDAAAVGIVLADLSGRLEFVAGSNENVKLLELFQLQNHEGPAGSAVSMAANWASPHRRRNTIVANPATARQLP